jgi:hypothetical protein
MPTYSASKDNSSNFIVRKSAAKDGVSSSITIRNKGAKDLSCSIWVRWPRKDLSSSFYVPNKYYVVERINNLVTLERLSGPAIVTADTDSTIWQNDVKGYSSFTVQLVNVGANGVVFTIQGAHDCRPGTWSTIGSAITLSGGSNQMQSFTGEYDSVRVIAHNQNAGSASRAWASMKARIGG